MLSKLSNFDFRLLAVCLTRLSGAATLNERKAPEAMCACLLGLVHLVVQAKPSLADIAEGSGSHDQHTIPLLNAPLEAPGLATVLASSQGRGAFGVRQVRIL